MRQCSLTRRAQELLPIPQEPGNFDDPAQVGPARTSLKPIHITQPEGPSFTVDGDEVRWEGWRLRIGYDLRSARLNVYRHIGFGIE
jgi:Cu2+-containing amine oxidase